MCNSLEHPHIAPGWGCCTCHIYNDVLRSECKKCGNARCVVDSPLPPLPEDSDDD